MTWFKQKWPRLLLVAGLVVLLDQLSKQLVLHSMPVGSGFPLIDGFFDIVHVRNPGGAFGFLSGQSQSVREFFFLFVTGVATIFILWVYNTIPETHRILASGLAMVFGGAVGNLIDRLRFGNVVDFIDWYIGDLHWPAFNLADSAICIGVGILIFHILFNRMPEEN
ncbi:signal peptidase II [Desulfoluna butyratoxydans]|uniref:Lipoprotein signal peptidase n=1 Tax=Desulfoluna butyratoxydans TaxID=231438 RepID=A0A4U8YQK1_9BACT|nr:signal peptidase II [Desulfoluna butyratoxydans]VFQ46131.1 peptidase a8 signal peptidase ii [Desulfoluna butyratoxydans]